MKSFLEEYGFSILAAIVVILLIMMISPLGVYFKSGMTTITGKFGGTAEGLANRLELLPDSDNKQDAQEDETTLGPGLYKNGTLVYNWDELFENGILVLNGGKLQCANKTLLDGDLVVPEEPIVFQGGAFSDCVKLESINIPEGTTSIEAGSFYQCSSLKKVKLPNTLTSISFSAFQGCTSLKSIDIPDSVTTIGYGVFYRCTSLEKVKLSNSLTIIDESVFAETSLKEFVIPSSVTEIRGNAISNANLETLVIPSTVERLSYGFLLNSHIGTIYLNNYYTSSFPFGTQAEKVVYRGNVTKITSINGVRENETSNLKTIVIDCDNPVTIPDSALGGLPALETVEFKSEIAVIDSSAFRNCPKLTSIIIPEGVTRIGDSAFNSTGLTSIAIPSSVREIGYGAFYGTPLQTAVFSVTSGWDDASVDLTNPVAAAERLKMGNILSRR